jgi:hypothetical protein
MPIQNKYNLPVLYWLRARRPRRSEFESRQGQVFSPFHVFQTGPGVHPTSYPVGTGGTFPGGKEAGA